MLSLLEFTGQPPEYLLDLLQLEMKPHMIRKMYIFLILIKLSIFLKLIYSKSIIVNSLNSLRILYKIVHRLHDFHRYSWDRPEY